MILITTAGKVGSEAARLLAERAEPVRILVRDPEKATALAQAGVDVAKGDLESPASIDHAMRGVSSVVLVSLAIPAQELNVVDSAARADVTHIVKITSKASADSPIGRRRGQNKIERGLIASGLGYTLLRNNAYMQNFLLLASAIAKTSTHPGCSKAGLMRRLVVDAYMAQHPEDGHDRRDRHSLRLPRRPLSRARAQCAARSGDQRAAPVLQHRQNRHRLPAGAPLRGVWETRRLATAGCGSHPSRNWGATAMMFGCSCLDGSGRYASEVSPWYQPGAVFGP